MNVIQQAIGHAVAEWQEDEPLFWEIRETRGEGKYAVDEKRSFDLRPLLPGYSRAFLLALKEVLILMRLRVALKTVHNELRNLRKLFKNCQDHFAEVCAQAAISCVVFERIDSAFLLGLAAVQKNMHVAYFETLRSLYNENRDNSALFSPDLTFGDFPMGADNQASALSQIRQRALAKAMSRSVLVEILNITEAAYEAGQLDLAYYAFSRLMLSRGARPETYRLLRCKDLRVDIASGNKSYFLTLTLPKAKTYTRPLATVSIHREVGQLLEKQREKVVRQLGHLVEEKNARLMREGATATQYTAGDLALFPAPNPTGYPLRKGIKDRLGMLRDSTRFIEAYVWVLKELTGREISCNTVRHTLATQLAITGCTAATIAAVLLHATTSTAKVYVDLMFEGVIDELSDSMEQAFTSHFPVYKEFMSAKDALDPESRIISCSTDRTRHETTGACGRRRICEYAPLSCYDCHRFIPAYDADHTINLDLVSNEIELARKGGLQRQTDVKRYTHIANRIRVVINVCELRRIAMESESANGGTAR